MTDTAHDELAALTAEAEAMSQRFEDEERVWQAQPSAGNIPDAERRGAESDQRTHLALLQETIASSRTLLDHAESPSRVPLIYGRIAAVRLGSRRVSTGKSGGGLTTPQAAALLGVSTQLIRGWVTKGRIRAERITPPVGKMSLVLNKEDVEQVRRERGPRDRG